MRHPPHEPDPERTFTALYRALYPDLVRFVQRRAPTTTPGRGCSASPAHPAPGRSSARPRHTVRRLVPGGAVLATAAGVVVLPAVSGGGDRAFASWTPVPSGMTPVERSDAVDSCRTAMEGGAGADQVEQLDRAMPAVAERRGTWTTVVLAGTDGFSALCITDSSAGFLKGSMLGSVGTPSDHVAPGLRGVFATDLGVGGSEDADLSPVTS